MDTFKAIAIFIVIIFLFNKCSCNQLHAQNKLPFDISTNRTTDFFEITLGGCPNLDVESEINYNQRYSERFLYRNLSLTDEGDISLGAVYGNERVADFCLVNFKNFKHNSNKVMPIRNLQFKWLESKNKLHIKLNRSNNIEKPIFNNLVLENYILKANNILSFDKDNFISVDTFSPSALGFNTSYNLFESLVTFPVTKFTLIGSANTDYFLNGIYSNDGAVSLDMVNTQTFSINDSIFKGEDCSFIAYDLEEKKVWNIPIMIGGMASHQVLSNTTEEILISCTYNDTSEYVIDKKMKVIAFKNILYLYDKVEQKLFEVYAQKYFKVKIRKLESDGVSVNLLSVRSNIQYSNSQDSLIYSITGIDTLLSTQKGELTKFSKNEILKQLSNEKYANIDTFYSFTGVNTPMSVNVVISLKDKKPLLTKYFKGTSILKIKSKFNENKFTTWDLSEIENSKEFDNYNIINNKLVVTLSDVADHCYSQIKKYRIYNK